MAHLHEFFEAEDIKHLIGFKVISVEDRVADDGTESIFIDFKNDEGSEICMAIGDDGHHISDVR